MYNWTYASVRGALFAMHTTPGDNSGANKWFLQSTPIQMLPPGGSICGRLTKICHWVASRAVAHTRLSTNVLSIPGLGPHTARERGERETPGYELSGGAGGQSRYPTRSGRVPALVGYRGESFMRNSFTPMTTVAPHT